MADIKLRIEVNPNAESEFLGEIINDNAMVSNTSIKVDSANHFINPPISEFDGSNGLLWGEEDYLVFNDNDELDNVQNTNGYLESEENPNEFFWGLVPENKEYRVKLTFTGASNLKDIVVFGDKVNNQFPTEAIVDGETTIYSDDYQWAINLGTESDTHTIEFTKWNRANYNACLTLVRVMLRYFEVDKANGLKSVESLSQSTGQPKDIFYGIVPNSGSVEVVDINGEIRDMVQDGVIPPSNVNIKILSKETQVQDHYTIDSEYKANTRLFTATLSNTLDKWKNIQVKENKFTEYQIMTLYDILEFLLRNYAGYSYDEILSSTKGQKVSVLGNVITIVEHLNNIVLSNPFITSGSLYDKVNAVCSIAQLNCVEYDDGIVRFVTARPIHNDEEEIISIPNKYQISAFSYDFIPKITYNNVRYNEKTFSESFNLVLSQSYDIFNTSEEVENVQLIKDDADKVYFCFMATISSSADIVRYENFKAYGCTSSITYVMSDTTKKEIDEDGLKQTEIMVSYLPKQEYNYNVSDRGVTRLALYSTLKTETFAFVVPTNNSESNLKSFKNVYANIKLYGREFSLSSQEKLKNSNKNIYELNYETNLLNTSTIYNIRTGKNVPMYDLITYNIMNDYEDGIITANTKVICGKYYSTNSNKLIVDWSKGQVLKLGNYVRVDKDNDGNSYLYTRDENPTIFKITGRNFMKDGVPLIDLELQQVNKDMRHSFRSDDWDTIAKAINDGNAQLFYSVGDRKVITLSTGERVLLNVLGFNHDDLSDGTGKAAITIGMEDLLTTEYRMNATNTNEGGWNNSTMRTETMEELFNQLPEGLRNIIKPVNKRTLSGDNSTTITTSQDKLWLLSYAEISGTNDEYYNEEGSQYAWWKSRDNVTDRRKYIRRDDKLIVNSWWLRTPDNNWYKIINRYGEYSSNPASDYKGVSFCFCI